MTTRTANLPIGVSAKSSDADPISGEPRKKVVKGLHPDFDFDVHSLKTWNSALEKGPQVGSVDHPEAYAVFRAKRKTQYVFWRLCLMMNSIYLHKGAKSLGSKNPPKIAKEMLQSLMDSLYHILKQWDDPVIPGPGLHASLCYLFVTRGMYKAIDTCPKQSQKMIHRILCVAYKQGLPMSDRVFGLEERGGEKPKKRRAQASPKDSRFEDEA